MTNAYARFFTWFTAAVFAVFFLYPTAMVLADAFRNKDGFTLEYFAEVFRNPTYREGLWNALALGVASTLATLLIAFPLAWCSHRYKFPGKSWLTAGLLVPLVLPPFVGAVGIKQMLGASGAFNAMLIDVGLMNASAPVDWLAHGRFAGMVAMNALHLYPILYLNIVAALSNLDPAMEQAAGNLGCPPWKRIWRITLPLAMPGVFAGCSIVFIWAFTELGVPLVFDYTRVASVQVYQGIKELGGNPLPFALVGVMLAVSVLVFAVSKKLFGAASIGVSPRPKGRDSARLLHGWQGWACSCAFLLILFVAILPHAGVVMLAFSGDWYGTVVPSQWTTAHLHEALAHPLVVPSIQNSLFYASGAVVLDLVLGLMMAWVIVRSKAAGRAVLDALVMLPLAVPGLVLAFGYLALSQPGRPFHFLLGPAEHPALLLVAAYAMRRLPYVVRAAVAGLQQSNPAMEEAARSLGATAWRATRRISLPLIGGYVGSGAILAFAFAMLEVSDSLIIAQRSEHYPITKAIYTLLSVLGNGTELAAALGAWAMIFLMVALWAAKRGRRSEEV